MTTSRTRVTGIHVGVDVGKFTLDIYIHERGLYWQVENTPEGIRSALNRIGRYKVFRLVVEATGPIRAGARQRRLRSRDSGCHRQALGSQAICSRYRAVGQDR